MKPKIRSPALCEDTLDYIGSIRSREPLHQGDVAAHFRDYSDLVGIVILSYREVYAHKF